MTTTTDLTALVNSVFDAIDAGDSDAIGARLDPSVRVWHNFDRLEIDFDATIAELKLLHEAVGLTVTDRRVTPWANGAIFQGTMRGTLPSGDALDCPTVMLLWIENDKITRVEEYFDSAQFDLSVLAG